MPESNNGLGAAQEAVLVQSEELPRDTPTVHGYDFNQGVDYDALFKSLKSTGFQATKFGNAVDRINEMLEWRLSHDPVETHGDIECPPEDVKATIFLGYTSNMASCGVRDVIRYLVQHKLVDAIVTTGGGVEEDFMKCLRPHYHGEFSLKGTELRKKGINRIGNLLVPNENYCVFEDWLTPILSAMLVEQQEQGTQWTPSRMISRLGKEIDNPESIYYWAHKNNIPVYCPALTDGSVGDMLFFQSFKEPGFVLDIVEDIRGINLQAMRATKTGMVILGGGVVKHHICNANLMRNGADYAVFVNTGQEFDGSDSGARPDEAVSWGKIKLEAEPVKVSGEASLIFPLLVSQTFAKYNEKRQAKECI